MFKPFDTQKSLPQVEEEVLKLWKEQGTFEQSVAIRNGSEQFVFYEGPPTANGKPGIHHVMARTFKDVICRFQTMKGKQVIRKAGWDTHGLPVELQVEKALGLKNKQDIEAYGIAEFNAKCRESVWQYKEEFEIVTDRMGYWVDLSDPYITYSKEYIESVWWGVKQVWGKDYIYQAHKVVPYCTRCGTSLSLAEVAQGYKNVEENSVYVKFRITDDSLQLHGKPAFVLAWTTTPWTLPGNVALAVGERFSYVAVEHNSEILILAKERLADLVKKGVVSDNIIATYTGSDLANIEYEPLFTDALEANDKAFKVYTADFVTTEDGTGIVHTAVMYGEDDYILGTKIGLPKQHTVDEQGNFVASVGQGLAGRYVRDTVTEQIILKYLEEKNRVLRVLKYKHDYPFCWRCDTALLYYARNSWFIRIDDKLRERLVELNQEIKWVPEHVKVGRFGNWLENLRDWAISRERYWGTPMPIWVCVTENTHRACIGSIEELESLATDNSKQMIRNPGFDLHKPYIDDIELTCPDCGKIMKRVPEVLDVWLDSGSMPFAQWHYPNQNQDLFSKQYPANFISEGIDQTRGWFNSLHILSTIIFDSVAYKSVITQNLVNDEHGKKMSKSKGNIVDPLLVMNEFGADALRFYFLSVNRPGDNKNFSTKAVQDIYRKNIAIWWNVVSFFLTYASVDNWEPGQTGEKTLLDHWIRARVGETASKIDVALTDLDTFTAARSLTELIDDLSTWYLRRSRKRRDTAFYSTLYEVLRNVSRIAAPFMPFTAEATYQSLKADGDEDSVHLTQYPLHIDQDKSIIADMNMVRDIVRLGHTARASYGIKLRQPLSRISVNRSLSAELEEIVADELNVKEVVHEPSQQELTVTIDPTLTPELKKEGLVRELIRELQDARKKAGCRPGEQVIIEYETESLVMIDVIRDHQELLETETTSKMAPKVGNAPYTYETNVSINDEPLWLGLKYAH